MEYVLFIGSQEEWCHDNVVKVVDEGDISCLDKRLKIRCVELYEIVPYGAIP